jgi:tetratricopeptide (TPR) repeat protein
MKVKAAMDQGGPPVTVFGGNPWLAPGLVFLAAVVVYLPSLSGEFIWNDPDYVTKPALRSVAGLGRIWTELGATEQYYPLLHTFFWIQQRFFGYDPLWYHAVNVLLHAACAALLVLVVRRLFRPDDGMAGKAGGRFVGPSARSNAVALLAGLIFAVHPVYVESVAWVSEQKNTFSLLWYLLAALAYLRFQEARARKWYVLATACFLAAILAKSVTATLPCALLVLAWWRNGRLERKDFWPLLPWIVLGAGMGALTGWVEFHFIGAFGDDFALSVPERLLLAGRVVWFYLGKYAWPAQLIFIYPRWTVDLTAWWQWLYPAAALGLLAGLWKIRGRARGPLAGFLVFVGSLVPTIGFFNVYAFRFSYVADHWNYLPSLALAVMGAWGAVWLRERWRTGWTLAVAAVAIILAVLSARQTRGYRNIEVFYQTILRENPDCWLAAHNLGGLRLNAGLLADAVPYYEQALRARPQITETINDLAGVLLRLGRRDEAIARYQEALRWAPNDADFHRNLGAALAGGKRYDEALVHLRRAVELRPAAADLHRLLAQALFESGRTEEAMAERAVSDRLTAKP